MRRLLLGVLVGVVAFSVGLIGVNEAVGRDHKKNNSQYKAPPKVANQIKKIRKAERKAENLERSFHEKMKKAHRAQRHETTHRNAMQKAHKKFEAARKSIDASRKQAEKKFHDSMRKIESGGRKRIDKAWTAVRKMANRGRGLCNEIKKDIKSTENRKRKMMRSKVTGEALVRKTKELARINNRIGQMYRGEKKCVKMMSRSTRRPSPKHRGPRVKGPGRHGTGGVAGPRHPGPRVKGPGRHGTGGVAGPRHPGPRKDIPPRPRKGMPRPRKGQNPPKN